MLHPGIPRCFLHLLLLLPWAAAQGQGERGPLREQALTMLHDALEGEQAYATLTALVRAAPNRLSGGPGFDAAVRWAEQHMKDLGLDTVRLEPVTVPKWVRGECEVSIVGTADAPLLPSTALGGSVGTPPEGLEARVIEVRSIPQVRALGEEAKGAIIFFNQPWDRSLRNSFTAYSKMVNQRSVGAIEAAKVGALAAVVRSVTSRADNLPHTGAMRYEDGVAQVPAAAISVLAADRLHALLEQGPVTLRMRMSCRTEEPVPTFNVVGELRGTEKPEEIVLIGAHLDSWDLGQGAQDDGAGVAHCLEAMRLIQAAGRPKRTVRVCLYANEENGLAGGRAYAEQHASELHLHVAALETDSGAGPPEGIGYSGGDDVATALEPLDALLRRFDLGRIREGGGGADISTLIPAGVPQLSYRPTDHRYFDHHHAASDTIDAVHPRELSLGAATIAIAAFTIADLDQPLPRKDPNR